MPSRPTETRVPRVMAAIGIGIGGGVAYHAYSVNNQLGEIQRKLALITKRIKFQKDYAHVQLLHEENDEETFEDANDGEGGLGDLGHSP